MAADGGLTYVPTYDVLVILRIDADAEEAITRLAWNTIDLTSGAVSEASTQVSVAAAKARTEAAGDSGDPPADGNGTSADGAAASGGVSIDEAVLRFDRWASESSVLKGRSWCLLTDSPAALTSLLPHAVASQLPPYFLRHFDLWSEIADQYPALGNAKDLVAVCKELDVSIAKDPSDLGIATALVAHLYTAGHRFESPRRSEPSSTAAPPRAPQASPGTLRAASALSSGSGEGDGDTAAADPAAQRVLRLRGLPFRATEEEVRSFFAPLNVARVVLHRDADGRSSGEAGVELDSESDMPAALERNRATMGQRWVSVVRGVPADMDESHRGRSIGFTAGRSSSGSGSGSGPGDTRAAQQRLDTMRRDESMHSFEGCAFLRGMPYNATAEDVVQFFDGIPLDANNVFMMWTPDSRPKGDCYVEFASTADAEEALKRSRNMMGSRYIEVFRARRVDMIDTLQRMYASIGRRDDRGYSSRGGGGGGYRDDGYYRSSSSSRRSPPPDYGRSSRDYGGSRRAGPPTAASRYHPYDSYGGGGGSSSGGNGGMPPMHQPPPPPRVVPTGAARMCMSGLPWDVTPRVIAGFFEGLILAPEGVKLYYGPDGRPTGRAYVDFVNAEHAEASLQWDGRYIGQSMVRVYRDPSAAAAAAAAAMPVGRPGYDDYHRGSVMPLPQQHGMPMHGAVPAVAGGAGGDGGATVPRGRSSVKMRGLPYQAGEGEIRQFFQGYNVMQIQVVRNSRGLPNGEAWVMFASPNEASHAVQHLDRRNIGRRYVELVQGY